MSFVYSNTCIGWSMWMMLHSKWNALWKHWHPLHLAWLGAVNEHTEQAGQAKSQVLPLNNYNAKLCQQQTLWAYKQRSFWTGGDEEQMHEMRLFLAVVRPHKPALPPLWVYFFFLCWTDQCIQRYSRAPIAWASIKGSRTKKKNKNDHNKTHAHTKDNTM